jgi:hypothetical protein
MAALVEPRSHLLSPDSPPHLCQPKILRPYSFLLGWGERWKILEENQPPTFQWCSTIRMVRWRDSARSFSNVIAGSRRQDAACFGTLP